MKLCYTCHREKPLTEFNKNKSKLDNLNGICKLCSRERSRRYYADNTEKHKRVVTKRKHKQIKENQNFIIIFLQDNSCVDCGEADIRTLEFDHIEEKYLEISKMIAGGYSINTIKKEIKKCEVVCANCHKKRTAQQFNWFKHQHWARSFST